MAERLVSGDLQEEDQDVSLRPKRLEDFVGQSNTKENLSISIQAAKIRQEPLDHVGHLFLTCPTRSRNGFLHNGGRKFVDLHIRLCCREQGYAPPLCQRNG